MQLAQFIRCFLRTSRTAIARNLTSRLTYALLLTGSVSAHTEATQSVVQNTISNSAILVRCLQWQLDANLSLTHQLLRDYESSVLTGIELLKEQESLLELTQSVNSNPALDDRLVELRLQWTELVERTARLEVALQSAIKTMHSSVESTFMCEPLICHLENKVLDTSQGVNLSAQACMQLDAIETEYHRLNERHAASVLRWSELLSQHVRHCTEEN